MKKKKTCLQVLD